MDEADRSNIEFSLTRGGPLFAILTSVGLVGHGEHDARRPGLVFAAISWGPMVLLALPRWATARALDPVVRDPAVHVRLLVAIPFFFLAEALLEERCASSFRRLVGGYLHRKTEAAPFARSAERLRDAWLAEAAILAISIALGQSALWGITSGSGALRGVGVRPSFTAAFVWYAVVGLPVFQFLLLRSLYRWAIWCRLLVSLSRIQLELVPTHPDGAGGISCVGEPVESFAVIVLAGASVVAATWGYRLVVDDIDSKAFASPFILLVVICMVTAFGPLFFFTVHLWRARIAGLREYSGFARRYTKLFHERWIIQANDESLLGTPDISGLADLGTSYEKLEKMKLVPFGPRLAIIVLAATFTPMVPILAIEQPIPQLVTSLGRALLGGLPP
jgi:hypothetical protein